MDWTQRLKSLVVDDKQRGRIRLKLIGLDADSRRMLFDDNDAAVQASLLALIEPTAADLKLGYGLEDMAWRIWPPRYDLQDDHPLSRFVNCLREETVKESIKSAKPDSVIKLPEGINWLGDLANFSSELYMRPCYFDLLEAKEEYFKKQDLNTVVYTGTPGIGKSHLCAYVVARNLLDGTVVYFERRPNSKTVSGTSQYYRLDLKNGAKRLDNFVEFDILPQDENAIYVVDGGPPTVWNTRLPAQIFASPSEDLYLASKKFWRYLYLHTPLFDLKEILRCRLLISEFSTVTREPVEDWYSAAGGVARVVLKQASAGRRLSAWKDDATTAIAKMDVNGLRIMISGLQQDTFSPGSDSLFHWHVDEKYVRASKSDSSPESHRLRRFLRKMVCFASRWIANQFFLKMRLENILKVVSFILSNTGGVEVAALRGYWFETLSHMIISSGGIFNCRYLGGTPDVFQLKLSEGEFCTFDTTKDASSVVKDDLSLYCLPRASNQVAIDSIISPYLLFQMTASRKHSINKAGLLNLVKALKDTGRLTQAAWDVVRRKFGPPLRTKNRFPIFVFCTTPANFQSYRSSQIFVEEGRKVEQGVPQIHQIVLEIPIDFLEERLEGDLRLKAVLKPGSDASNVYAFGG